MLTRGFFKINSTRRMAAVAVVRQASLLLAAAVSLALILGVSGAALATTDYDGDGATDRLTYTPPALLAYGTHTVRIVARDAAGNIKIQQWSFKVVR